MERREFIRSSCNVCMLAAAGYFLPKLAGCSPASFAIFKTDIVDKKVELPLTMFSTSTLQFIRPNGWYYNIAVEKKEDNTYTALLLQCTHQENQLTPNGNNGFTCTLHGSVFDKEGRVRKGPAQDPLVRYTTYVENDHLVIEVPLHP